jgi:hypothetical protein
VATLATVVDGDGLTGGRDLRPSHDSPTAQDAAQLPADVRAMLPPHVGVYRPVRTQSQHIIPRRKLEREVLASGWNKLLQLAHGHTTDLANVGL